MTDQDRRHTTEQLPLETCPAAVSAQSGSSDHEAMAEILMASGNYRILRKLQPLPFHRVGPHDGLRCAIVVDCESTGIILPGSVPPGAAASEVVSLAMTAVAYRAETGEIVGSIGSFNRLRQPSHPIPPEATLIHHLTDADVAGYAIEATDIAEWIAQATASVQSGVVFGSRDEARLPLVVAHNARFDRQLLESHWPEVFADLPWACSQTDIPWAKHGAEGLKLSYLAAAAGIFYDNHNALDDCHAVVAILQQVLGGRSALGLLREAAQQSVSRVFAIGAPYDARHTLKARAYRWNAGTETRPRSWFRDCTEAELGAERAFLRETIGLPNDPLILPVDAFDRYSQRG